MKKLFHAGCLLFLCTGIQGQSLTSDLISTSGEFLQNSSVSLSYSIGECINESFSGANAMLTQGFQQSPGGITLIEKEKSDVEILVYPIPANNDITIRVKDYRQGLTASIFDPLGILVAQSMLLSNESTLQLNSFPSGNYILLIEDLSGVLLQYFQLIKL